MNTAFIFAVVLVVTAAAMDAVLAHSLLRSLPRVDAAKINIMDVLWSGIITDYQKTSQSP